MKYLLVSLLGFIIGIGICFSIEEYSSYSSLKFFHCYKENNITFFLQVQERMDGDTEFYPGIGLNTYGSLRTFYYRKIKNTVKEINCGDMK